MRTWGAVAGLVMLLVPSVRADEHEEMRAAMHELKIVERHLKTAPPDYAGHRVAALKHVQEAMQEVRLALAMTKAGKSPEPAPRGGEDD